MDKIEKKAQEACRAFFQIELPYLLCDGKDEESEGHLGEEEVNEALVYIAQIITSGTALFPVDPDDVLETMEGFFIAFSERSGKKDVVHRLIGQVQRAVQREKDGWKLDILALPTVLKKNIAFYCDLKTVGALECVCKSWHLIIDCAELWEPFFQDAIKSCKGDVPRSKTRLMELEMKCRILDSMSMHNMPEDTIKWLYACGRFGCTEQVPNASTLYCTLSCAEHEVANRATRSWYNLWETLSLYKGVKWDRVRRKWSATIRHNNKDVTLGFGSELQAAKLVDEAAVRFFGKSARLNCPLSEEVVDIQPDKKEEEKEAPRATKNRFKKRLEARAKKR